jgi:hypothetical protein
MRTRARWCSAAGGGTQPAITESTTGTSDTRPHVEGLDARSAWSGLASRARPGYRSMVLRS